MFLKNKKILVIDDEQEIARLIEVVLQGQKINVISSKDPLIGIAMARSEIPNLIIVDLMLPKMNGLEVCKILKEDLTTKDIPIFIMSGSSKCNHREEGY